MAPSTMGAGTMRMPAALRGTANTAIAPGWSGPSMRAVTSSTSALGA